MINHSHSDFEFHPDFVDHVTDIVTKKFAELRKNGYTLAATDKEAIASLLDTLREVFHLDRNTSIAQLKHNFSPEASPETLATTKIVYKSICETCGGAVGNAVVLYYLLLQNGHLQSGAKALLEVRKIAHLTNW